MKSRVTRIALLSGLSTALILGLFLFLPRENSIPEKDSNTTENLPDPEGPTDGGKIPNKMEGDRDLGRVDAEDMDSRSAVEKRMGRKFTKDEISLKPPELPWHAFGYSVQTHRNADRTNGSIKFYGKVVDEEGEPLEGVSLTGEVS